MLIIDENILFLIQFTAGCGNVTTIAIKVALEEL